MKICPTCGAHVEKDLEMRVEFLRMRGKCRVMRTVIDTAIDLVDIAGTDADTEDVAAAASTLATVVAQYKKLVKQAEEEEGENVV